MKKIILFLIFLQIYFVSNSQLWNSSQTCQTNANNNSLYEDLKRATFKYRIDLTTSSYGNCTGTLLNRNTPEGNIGQFFLTSWHCLNDIQRNSNDEFNAWLYFNYQSPTGQTFDTPDDNKGAVNDNENYRYRLNATIKFITKSSMVQGDMALCEILTPIPPHFNVYFSGWSPDAFFNNFNPPFSTFHHPKGDIKKVSSSLLPVAQYSQPISITCKTVTKLIDFLFGWIWKRRWTTQVICNYVDWPMMSVTWTSGNTEPGSSGSSLFKGNEKIIGNLSNGWIGANCNSILRRDNYGKFSNYYVRQDFKNTLNPENKWWIDQSGISGRKINCYPILLNISGRYYPTAQYSQYISSQTISSQSVITTQNNLTIFPQANFIFNASQNIILNPGFQAENGSIFQAQIQPCSVSNSTYKSANNKSSTNSEYETPDLAEVLESIAVPKNKFFDITKFKHSQSKATNYYNDSIFLKTDIYPNPSSNIVKIESYFKEKISHIYICIYDINGKLVSTNKIFNNLYYLKTVLNISNLQNGMYNLVIYADNHSLSKHIVVLK